MPRYEKLSLEELEAIRRFIEEADEVDLIGKLACARGAPLATPAPQAADAHTALAIKLLASAFCPRLASALGVVARHRITGGPGTGPGQPGLSGRDLSAGHWQERDSNCGVPVGER